MDCGRQRGFDEWFSKIKTIDCKSQSYHKIRAKALWGGDKSAV